MLSSKPRRSSRRGKTDAAAGDGAELLSIGSLAEASGISVDTLRVWERRYGKPKPIRLPSGHRRYTGAHVRWARRVAEALAAGHRTAAVVRSSDDELERLVADAAPPPEPEKLEPILVAVRGYRDTRILERLWADWRRLGPEAFLERVLDPLLVMVGRAWVEGELDVRHEHFISEVVEHFLRAARVSLPVSGKGPVFLLTTLEGELHGLGIQMAAVTATRAGARPRVLGVSTPIAEIVKAAGEVRADVVGISISLHTGGVETDRQLAELRRRLPPRVRLIAGGAGARGARRGPRGVEYAESLPHLGELLRRS